MQIKYFINNLNKALSWLGIEIKNINMGYNRLIFIFFEIRAIDLSFPRPSAGSLMSLVIFEKTKVDCVVVNMI